jgi:Uncharacterised protein family (UPF0158)
MSESSASIREVPVDWEALEDAFENNAPEVHSYLHVVTGEVIRVVDGIADPGMHTKIASHSDYLRIDPVSSREQYRWMERFIPMVEDDEVQRRLGQAIDGKGAFRRFKDVLMGFATERERWFSFRSERLRVFMEAWLLAHSLRGIARPTATPDSVPPPAPESAMRPDETVVQRGARPEEALRRQLMDVVEVMSPLDLEKVLAFAEFVSLRFGERNSDKSRGLKSEVMASLDAPFEKDPPTQRRPSAERRS